MSDVSKKTDSLDWIKSAGEPADDSEATPVSGDVVLEGSLGIAEAEGMHHIMSGILDAGVDVSIQSENLSRVDAAGAQLLYAFVKEVKKRAITLKWESVSDTLQEVAATLGLSEGMGFEVSSAS